MGSGENNRILFAVLALGGLSLIPIATKLYRDWRARRQAAVATESE